MGHAKLPLYLFVRTSFSWKCKSPCLRNLGNVGATRRNACSRGEFTHLFGRLIAHVKFIRNNTPNSLRTVYLFTNVLCGSGLSRRYPDFCRYQVPPNVIDLLGKQLRLRVIWLTVCRDVLTTRATYSASSQ